MPVFIKDSRVLLGPDGKVAVSHSCCCCPPVSTIGDTNGPYTDDSQPPPYPGTWNLGGFGYFADTPMGIALNTGGSYWNFYDSRFKATITAPLGHDVNIGEDFHLTDGGSLDVYIDSAGVTIPAGQTEGPIQFIDHPLAGSGQSRWIYIFSLTCIP